MGFIEKHKKKILLGITAAMIVVIAITSFYSDKSTIVGDALSYVVAPIQKGLDTVSGFIGDKIDFIVNATKFKEENQKLITQIEELQTEINHAKLYKKDNERLNELLGLKDKYSSYNMIASEVIGKDLGNWYETFYIDKGNKSGITEGMVVLAQTGLVGKVTKTNAKYSTVMSIIDDRSAVSAKILRTDDVGVVRGDASLRSNNEGLCKMVFIDANAEIIVGDEIVTSHLGEYPPGITIGIIKEIQTENDGLTKSAIIKPVVDFKHIETVMVMDGKEDYNVEE